MSTAEELKSIIKGDVETSEKALEHYSRDTSLFKVMPELVVFPKDEEDVRSLVKYVSGNKENNPDISITARAAGSDMSGGPLNESIILDVTKHLNHILEIDEEKMEAEVEPGVYYRDFERETLEKKGILLPSYPASKDLAALGGLIANNAAGERTLRYGKTNKYVKELDVVLSDGNAYTFKKLSREELEEKKKREDFEGEVYRKMHNLLEENYELVQEARPDVSKNSAGYALWDVWDRESFDLTQLFTGSQGTLGIITRAKLGLVKDKPYKKLAVLFFKDWKKLPRVVNKLLKLNPEEIEAFDDETMKLGLRFMPQIAWKAHKNTFMFLLSFLPEAIIGIRMLGIPKLVLLVQFAENSEEELSSKVDSLKNVLDGENIIMRVMKDEDEAQKYWITRRESFALLREFVGDKQTAPFIDDVVVKPEFLPEFLPKVLEILKEHNIHVTLAGHAGSGNFHIIPLMDLTKEEEKQKILEVSDKVYDLVVKYKGSITAEHNDGIIRTPYLKKMYGDKVYKLFEEVKRIFDPQNIFNPGKKVGGSKRYIEEHISPKSLS